MSCTLRYYGLNEGLAYVAPYGRGIKCLGPAGPEKN